MEHRRYEYHGPGRRGTGESYVGDDRTEVTGLLSAVTDCLDRRFIAQCVPYAASYGPVPHRDGLSYAESVDDGVANLAAAFGRATAKPETGRDRATFAVQ